MKITTSLIKELIDTNQLYLIKKIKKLIVENASNVDWKLISCVKMSEAILEEFKVYLNNDVISLVQSLSVTWLRNNPSKVNYNIISKYQKLDRSYIRDNKHLLTSDRIIEFQDCICDETDSTFIDELSAYFDKNKIITFRKVPEAWLELNYASLDKVILSKYKLSEAFIDAHFADLNKNDLIIHGSIDTDIKFFKYQAMYPALSIHKALEFIQFSEEYLLNNIYQLNPYTVLRYQKNISINFLISKSLWFDNYIISKYTPISSANIAKFINPVYSMISKYKDLPMEYIELHKYELHKKFISKYRNLSQQFMIDNPNCIDIYLITMYQVLGPDVIEKYKSRFNYDLLFTYQTVNEQIISEAIRLKLIQNLNNVVIYQPDSISEVFIAEHYDMFNKTVLSKNKQLSLSFINNNLDNLDMFNISLYQGSLTESWINTNKDLLNIDNILINTGLNLSQPFKDGLIDWFINTKTIF